MGYMNQAAIDRFFLGSCDDRATIGTHRYQFLEAITRIANAKFKEVGLTKTLAQAVERLLKEHYFEHGPVDE